MKYVCVVCLLFSFAAMAQTNYPTTGTFQRLDKELDAVLSPAAAAEIIATGFEWSEGPLWIAEGEMLLFSDVPQNTIYQWTEKNGASVYLRPSGYTGTTGRGGETGSNGLLLDDNGKLVLCQHGDRRLARMDAPLLAPTPVFSTLAGNYQGKRFNSPNDAVMNANGDFFFTDPPYGLEKNMEDPLKELPFQGVFKRSRSGDVVLLTDAITRPNGITFLPGEKTLLVGNSDSTLPIWYALDLDEKNEKATMRVFYNAAGYDPFWKGNIDGLKVDRQGIIFATGPGGLWIFNASGKLQGRLLLDAAASNCALSPDEKTLYITNHHQILRYRIR
jgi:gluconolactonase